MAHTRLEVRRVLCPVDFSEPSTRALEHAVRLASFFGATLHVLHVVPPLLERIEHVSTGTVGSPEGPRESALRELAAFVHSYEWHVSIDRCVRVGSPAPEIEQLAESLPADLVVMGTRGRGGLAHLVAGSVTARVMHRVACPVLAVSARQTSPPALPPYRRILCATKLRPGDHALDFALALAGATGAELQVLHVVEELPAAVDGGERDPALQGFKQGVVAKAHAELRQAIARDTRDDRVVRRRLATGLPAPAILEAARDGHADLVILGAHAPALDRALFGSTVRRVLRDAPCAVLVLGRLGAAQTAAAGSEVPDERRLG